MNKVTTVCKTLVYKRYSLSQKCAKEMEAIEVLRKLVPQNIPEMVFSQQNMVALKFVEGTDCTNCTDIEAVNLQLAGILAKIRNSYKSLPTSDRGSWLNNVVKTKNIFSRARETILKFIDIGTVNKIATDLETIHKIAGYMSDLTYTHRDLHKGNLIFNGRDLAILDFEHAIEGPIELEFQNSLFWKDEMSLDITTMVKLLRELGIAYSSELENLLKSYYIADQIILADAESDTDKLGLLAAKLTSA